MDAELHFVSMGPQYQPAAFHAPGLPENLLRPSAIEFKSPDVSPVPALDQDLITADDHALAVAGMAFHISECENHHYVDPVQRKAEPAM